MIDKVKNILSDKLGLDINTIKDDTSIIDDLGADSLDVVEIIMEIEDQFGITVPDDDVTTLKTVRDISDYVDSKM